MICMMEDIGDITDIRVDVRVAGVREGIGVMGVVGAIKKTRTMMI